MGLFIFYGRVIVGVEKKENDERTDQMNKIKYIEIISYMITRIKYIQLLSIKDVLM